MKYLVKGINPIVVSINISLFYKRYKILKGLKGCQEKILDTLFVFRYSKKAMCIQMHKTR